MLVEEIKHCNLEAVITFIDFSKAFDSLYRGEMMKILRAIELTYMGTRAKVRSPDGETNEFDITARVLQGETLAPYLFVIAIEYAMRMAPSGREVELGFTITKRKSQQIGPVVITDLDFADDIVETEAANLGLHINASKTKVLSYNVQPAPEIKTISGD
jgi:hypothetical protein